MAPDPKSATVSAPATESNPVSDQAPESPPKRAPFTTSSPRRAPVPTSSPVRAPVPTSSPQRPQKPLWGVVCGGVYRHLKPRPCAEVWLLELSTPPWPSESSSLPWAPELSAPPWSSELSAPPWLLRQSAEPRDLDLVPPWRHPVLSKPVLRDLQGAHPSMFFGARSHIRKGVVMSSPCADLFLCFFLCVPSLGFSYAQIWSSCSCSLIVLFNTRYVAFSLFKLCI